MRIGSMLRGFVMMLIVAGAGTVARAQVVWYEFNGNLNPSIGSAPTPQGTVSWAPDRFGTPNAALRIAPTGTPTYLDLPVNDDTPQRTVSFWFNAASVSGSNLGMIYESDGPHIANGQTQFGVTNGILDYVVGLNRVIAPVVAGRWYFAAIVRSATDVRFYLDCQLVSTRTLMVNSHSVNHGSWVWRTKGRIGNTSEDRPTEPPVIHNYNGLLDDFRIYNTALTQAQLAATMGSGTLTPAFTIATSFCAGVQITANGTASSGAPLVETHYFWEIAESDANGNILAGAPSWNQWYQGTAGPYTFPSASNGGPAFLTCGRYYKVKLAIANCLVQWAETTKVIYLACNPNVAIEGPEWVCGASVTTLVASGANSYRWSPGNQTTTAVNVHPANDCGSGNCSATTYTVTGTNAYGCSSTASRTVKASPTFLDIDLGTGRDPNQNLATPGSPDAFWKVRGRASSSVNFTAPFASLPAATVVTPWQGTTWASLANTHWVTSDAIGTKADPNAPPGHNHTLASSDYWYERRFFIPPVGYTNLYFGIGMMSADNVAGVYFNRPNALTGSATDFFIDKLPNHNTFCCVYGPFVINQPSRFKVGENVLQVRVSNFSSSSHTPTGFAMSAVVTGQCTVQTVPCRDCL